jgi:hypothetical protein
MHVHNPLVPAKAGTQGSSYGVKELDSRFRGNEPSLRQAVSNDTNPNMADTTTGFAHGLTNYGDRDFS